MLTNEQFEALAKRVADVMAGHDTAGEAWRDAGFSKHNGAIWWRMWKGERSRAVKSVEQIMATRFNPPISMPDDDLEIFVSNVLAHLIGGGFDVEWEEEEEEIA